MADEPFQSLYRRYRPARFDEVRGQDHITTALRNAVRHGRVAHAYLFSGPRGTGKTSTARILAAALNCPHLDDGEPDGTCESCVAIRTGGSLDVFELDAASNNGVDAMRDLVTRAALGSPGRTKVYIVDEVHMLTTGASNALLKTLEEPPAHVVFILATTDDQKVLPTIKSRTQHFRFRLLAPEVLSSLLADVNDLAALGLDPGTLDRVVRKGNGSARDALSALDQAAAAGGADEEGEAVTGMVEALIARDPGAALIAIADAATRGRDPHRLAVEFVEHLRAGFLLVMAPDVAGVPVEQRGALEDQARRLGTPATVRAMEVLGETLIDMRESLDTRVTLELALVRLCAPAADTSPAAIIERLEMVERRLGAMGPGSAAGGPGNPPGESPAAFGPSGAGARPDPTPGPGSSTPDAHTRTAPPSAPAPPRPPASANPPRPPASAIPPRLPASAIPPRSADSPSPPASGASGGRPTIGAMRQRAAVPAAAAPNAGVTGAAVPAGGVRAAAAAVPAPAAAALGPDSRQPGPGGGPTLTLDRDELTKAWGDRLFPNLGSRTRAVYRNGRWMGVDGATAVFALPTEMYRQPAEEKRSEVEGILAAHFGGPVWVRIEIDASTPPVPPPDRDRPAGAPLDAPAGRTAQQTAGQTAGQTGQTAGEVAEEVIDPIEFARLPTAPDAPTSAAARLLEAFPGSEEVSE